jgi:Domain of unknown function (DUF4160)
VSPTIFREGGLRFFFFSREEKRPHVHATSADGEAKIWLEPSIELANNYGLSDRELREALRLAEERRDEIKAAWHAHFGA